ncbi:PREDICTED: uncharacterized protein LOC109347833 [Lupinus angustifolius]|uniref:uncharacterized protein LOC109343126 n=1 Tax=Lupinus angustifolius TaxID=3871 RepID=UPI00092EF808|nr:PREDICTED: uncharacterized protein LOC109343126 [Lupinus angustifolius]XP_019443466.1 PREDICTED: uncharacterized protein LOC109347833 [Lupinus angustifolius]
MSSSTYPSCCSGNSPSNLQRFLQCVTPLVPSHTMPQRSLSDINSLWQPLGKDLIKFFSLKDLWDCYYEWSAYGASTPVMLENGDIVVQYYVPHLSAIQIYTNKSVAASRNRREDSSDGNEFESDSWSDDSGSDKLSRSLSDTSSKAWDSISEDSSFDQEGSSPRDKLGHLYLEFTETTSPYSRIPLMEKITELAKTYPALMTLKSVDLSPASWMAVSWYPIYTIPSRKNDKDLEAGFLTYHTLSSSFEDCAMENDDDFDLGKDICCYNEWRSIVKERLKKKESGCISLPPFGLATYKMQENLWLKPDPRDYERVCYLYSAAESWLKQLNVYHHDINFFTFHPSIL